MSDEKPPVPAADLEWILPELCPGCGKPALGKILTCERCWNFLVPQRDRVKFAKLYFSAPADVDSYRATAKRIVEALKSLIRAYGKRVEP